MTVQKQMPIPVLCIVVLKKVARWLLSATAELLRRMIVYQYLQLYEEVKEDNDGIVDASTPAFSQLKDLARRFTLTFGVDQLKNRESVAAIHKYVPIINT